jgi:hypothetical protein
VRAPLRAAAQPDRSHTATSPHRSAPPAPPLCHAPSVLELEASKASLESQMEGMLGRLRELEGEKQQLDARQVRGE